MHSTTATIAAAAISGADLGAKASSVKGSDAASKKNVGALASNGFDANEAEAWLQNRWKAVYSSSSDKKLTDSQRPEVYKPAPGASGSAWGPNKKTINERFTSDLLKASTMTASTASR